MANLDSSVSALCLAYSDLLQAKVTIHDTLAQYLDARNFPQGNTTADPSQEKLKVFYIDARSTETDEVVEFILSSPMDLQGRMIPAFAVLLVHPEQVPYRRRVRLCRNALFRQTQ